MTSSQFKAHIEKRRLPYSVGGKGWYCITRETSDYSDGYGIHGPLRSKREAKLVKDSAKRSYVESRKGQ